MLDRVIAFAARDEAETVEAREEWAEQAGRVFDDDALYEERTTAFLEWYALERQLPSGRRAGGALPRRGEARRPRGRAGSHALATSHRTLFEVQKVHDGIILLDDLLGGGTFAVTERRRLPGVEESEIFEARLVANVVTPPELLFTRAFQFHPREARGELKRQAERARKAGEPRAETLFRLVRLRLEGAALQARHGRQDLPGRMTRRGARWSRCWRRRLARAQTADPGVAVERLVPAVGPASLVGVEGAAVTPTRRRVVGSGDRSPARSDHAARRLQRRSAVAAGARSAGRRRSAGVRPVEAAGARASACRWCSTRTAIGCAAPASTTGAGTVDGGRRRAATCASASRPRSSTASGPWRGDRAAGDGAGGRAVGLRRHRRRHRRAAPGGRRALRAADAGGAAGRALRRRIARCS